MNGHRPRTMASILALGTILLLANQGLGGVLNVDIGGAGQETLPGFETFTIAAYGAVPVTHSYTNGLANTPGGQVTVVLDTGSTITGLAGTGQVNHPISNVVEELAYIDSWLSLTLQNLKAGTYYFRSYHHDPNTVRGNVDIFTSDAVASNVQHYDELVQTMGATPGIVGTAPMILKADGTGDVVIRVARTGSLRATTNGFELTDTLPSDLKIDIGRENANNDVQAGYQSFAVANDGGAVNGTTSAPQAHWYFTEMGNQGSVEVKVSDATTGSPRIGLRDRGDVGGSLGDLVEDAVYNAVSRELTLTLGSLKPGAYSITSFHNDAYNHGTLNIRVTDPLGADQDRVLGLAQSTGVGDSANAARATYSFVSNGIDPVVITFESPNDGSDPFVMLNGFTATAHAALRVDFGQEPGPGRDDVQNGFERFNAANHTGSFSDGVYRDYASPLAIGDTIRVQVNCDDGSLLVRDRGDVVGPLGDVSEDFIFDGFSLEVVLSNLQAGRYAMSTYHHDAVVVQGTFDILVTDAAGNLRTVATGLTHSTGFTGAPTTATFEVFADGANDLIVRLQKTSGGGLALGGFSLSLMVPEPSSLLLAALGGLLLPMGRRRRRRSSDGSRR